MSFLTIGTDTIRDLWPEIGRPLNDISLEEEQLEEWQLVPDTFSGVCNWAELVMDEGECSLGKRHRLVYKHRDGEALFEVCIRAQGYVDKHSLGPLGNWNGTTGHCAKAAETLELVGNSAHAVFALQHLPLAHIRQFILTKLHSKIARSDAEESNTIRFRNRVFTKVKPGDRDPPLSVLQLGDDPEGRAAKVQSQWIVAHSVNYGLEKPDGKQEACSALTFQKGDFVEVAFTVDILTTFVKNRKATDISFVMEEVLRLRPASETKKETEPVTPNPKTPAIVATASGLKLPKRKLKEEAGEGSEQNKKMRMETEQE